MTRIVKYTNLAVGLLLVAGAIAFYWFVWRPLPQTSGSIAVPLGGGATITRDELGVPHIRGASEEDAIFLQGYVTAEERLWQMDGLRRLSGGNLAEIIGPAALETDRESRRLRLRRIAEEAYSAMPPKDRAAFAAYTRGVNAFLISHLDRLPLEFRLLSYEPRLWSGVDCMLVGLHMFRTLTTTWRDEITKRNMLARGDPGKINALFPVRSGAEMQPGSNAWVVGGARTASGKPLLSNDMHLEYSIPGIWFMVHLQAPGLDVAGVSLPGVPGLIVGHNQRIAWGVTNLHYDVQDLYLEKIDLRSGRYLFRGQTEQARREQDVIQVKGAKPEETVTWVTRHGPIFFSDSGTQMSLRWVAAEARQFEYPFLELNRAQNWQQFTAALSRFPGPPQNFVYADVDGNIGYQAAGKLPIRKGYAGDLPVDGSSGENEWAGFIPFDQLPSAFNPPSGLIVTANQNPFPQDYAYAVSGNFASPYRSNQIRSLLSSRKGWSAVDMLAVQKDVYSSFGHFLAKSLVAAYETRKARNPGLDQAITILRNWNGQMEYSQAAPLIVRLVDLHLRRALIESAAPGSNASYEFQMAPAVIEKLLRTQPAGWFKDYDAALLSALSDAMDEGGRMQGRNPDKWTYGHYLTWLVAHPVGHRLPLVARYFDIGPAPMSGSSTTVKQTGARMGPSMRMTADLANWDRSLCNLPVGQSGHVLSRHYKDQWNHYYIGRSFSMQFQKVHPESVLHVMSQQ